MTSLILFCSLSAVPQPNAAIVVEQTAVGLMGAVAAGFITGEIAWIAAPKITDTAEEYPLRIKQEAALATAYGLGMPFGAALGVHVSGLVAGRASSFWPKWIGAEITTLAADGVSLLVLSEAKGDTTPYLVDTPLEILAAALPLPASVGGAFLGEFVGQRLGWASGGVPAIQIGFRSIGGEPALCVRMRLGF